MSIISCTKKSATRYPVLEYYRCIIAVNLQRYRVLVKISLLDVEHLLVLLAGSHAHPRAKQFLLVVSVTDTDVFFGIFTINFAYTDVGCCLAAASGGINVIDNS
jgi:hypothetical protein